MKDKRTITFSVDSELAMRLSVEVERLKQDGTPGCSTSKFIADSIRLKLDGPERPPTTQPWRGPQGSAPPVTHSQVNAAAPAKSAKDLLARFAGMGVTTAAALEDGPIQVGNCPVEEVEGIEAWLREPAPPKPDWQKLYNEMSEMEPYEAEHAFKGATADVKLPVGFRKMPPAKQVQWLRNNA